MNHTIKGIIIVVVITSMLIVGAASMVSIMQNSFAERDTNTNTNTNSADSTSSSSATADNTNNINNTACTVTVSTCPEGSKTIRQTPTPTPTNGTLVIEKLCAECAEFQSFSIQVTGNNPQPPSFSLTNEHERSVILGPGNYTVTETPASGFLSPGFRGDCKRTAPGSHEATGTISAGQNLRCIILNTPQ